MGDVALCELAGCGGLLQTVLELWRLSSVGTSQHQGDQTHSQCISLNFGAGAGGSLGAVAVAEACHVFKGLL